jgi:GR25 family glycosyltransferase involved in LPS biosynthesis/CDP-glycerol glycerophosphotransferase (TagB/SpsB family)
MHSLPSDDAMTSINWNIVDRVIFINLKTRKDRLTRITKQLKKLGVAKDKIVRLDAIKHEIGYIGCTQSHIAALELARDNGWEKVLILEDDFAFNETQANYDNLNRYFAALTQINWQVAFLAANYRRVTPLKSVEYIVRANYAWCACAYMVNSRYYPTLIENYREALQAQLQGGAQAHYALDVHWNNCMEQDLWLGIFPNSGAQHPDKSDIEKRTVDYRALFNKPLSQIVTPTKFTPSISGPIKVDFYFQWPPGWTNFESVIDAMQANPAFDCRIVVVPYLNWKASDANGDIQRGILQERGLDYTGFEAYQLEERQPDVVFLQNPYDEARPEAFRSEYLHERGVKIAYIPYALDTGIGTESMFYQYNLLCQNLATWIFARSDKHKAEFAVQCQAGNRHVHVTGHPKFDHYQRRFHLAETPQPKPIKTFLWAPHFVLPGNQKMYSTFTLYCSAFLTLIQRQDIHLIIRPHPLLSQWIEEANPTARNLYQQLLSAAQQYSHVEWDSGHDYTLTFARSDALIADAGSFLLEYLPSKKPILYLTHETCHGLNRTAEFIYDAYDVARQEEDIFTFVDNIVAGRDAMKTRREKVLQEELQIEDKTAGEKIADIICASLRPQAAE